MAFDRLSLRTARKGNFAYLLVSHQQYTTQFVPIDVSRWGRFVVPKTCFARCRTRKSKDDTFLIFLWLLFASYVNTECVVSQCVYNATLSTGTLSDEGSVHCVACVCAEGDKYDGCGLSTVNIKATCLIASLLLSWSYNLTLLMGIFEACVKQNFASLELCMIYQAVFCFVLLYIDWCAEAGVSFRCSQRCVAGHCSLVGHEVDSLPS